MKKEKCVNIGILAHVDAGKTTTVEHMLHACGAIKAPGSVDRGDTQTDWLAVERERGISVRSSATGMTYKGVRINVIDTPGHVDFSGEVERALSVLDAAVLVVSAPDGVQPQTEKFWAGIAALGLPCIIFVNKCDRTGADPMRVEEQIRRHLAPRIAALNAVCNAGTPQAETRPRALAAFSDEEVYAIVERDEPLALRVLEGERVGEEEIGAALREQVRRGNLCPLLFGAAMQGQGIDDLLEAIVAYAPASFLEESGEPAGMIYKVEHDDKMGKVAHVRLFAGRLKNRDQVALYRPGEPGLAGETWAEKATQIRRVSGKQTHDTGILCGGDVAAVYGLTRARAGDVLGDPRGIAERIMGRRALAVPLMSVRAIAAADKQNALLEAIARLTDEDPLLNYEWNAEERELSIRIMGRIQTEVLTYVLKERYDLDVSFSTPLVIYRETPAQSGVGYESYTMPKPCWAVVKLQIDPLPRGTGYAFESRVPDSEIFYRYQNHIATAVPETLRQGLQGWQVTDLKVTLVGGEHHVQHTHNMDFFLATPIAVMDGLRNCGTTLLEPLVKMRLSADESLAGRLIGDILGMRGETGSPVIANGTVHMEAIVPIAASMDYPIAFASLTAGKGRISVDFHGYGECPAGMGAERKRNGINPLDRAKWILHRRGAV